MKKDKIIYWIATGIFFTFDAVLPAFTSHTEVAKQGISHLGYPDYFRVLLAVFKVCGGIVLIFPQFPPRIKEWAYAGFTFSLIAACVSHAAVDGATSDTFFPIIVLIILFISYFYYHKIYVKKSV
ncbi:MAG: DoxX family protein [Mucilaginibacter polytrichastri]|nr:DoxX family protein [Mucilaginibacter polytrichastri]